MTHQLDWVLKLRLNWIVPSHNLRSNFVVCGSWCYQIFCLNWNLLTEIHRLIDVARLIFCKLKYDFSSVSLNLCAKNFWGFLIESENKIIFISAWGLRPKKINDIIFRKLQMLWKFAVKKMTVNIGRHDNTSST